MKAAELAYLLNGREYGNEITESEEKQAKEAGLVVVFGYSDDNTEFRGAIDEEISCYDGGIICFNKDGSNFTDETGEAGLSYHIDKEQPEANRIEAVFGEPYEWAEGDEECSWQYKTDIPHEIFKIMEGRDLYCVGIVFSVNDLK